MSENEGAMVALKFESTLGGRGDSVTLTIEGNVPDVQRAAGQVFLNGDPAVMDEALSDVAVAAAARWVELVSALSAGGDHARAATAVLGEFPDAKVVGESSGRPIGEPPTPVAAEHKHEAYKRGLNEATTSVEVRKMAEKYRTVPDHDPDLLDQMRRRFVALAGEERAAGK